MKSRKMLRSTLVEARRDTEVSVLHPTMSTFTFAAEFGLVGDSIADDTAALQAALDSAGAGNSGGTVLLPKGTFHTTSPLHIPAGVTLKGQGYGSSPLAIKFDAGASTIAYCGTDYAVIMDGHAASLQDVAVYDWKYPEGSQCDSMQAKGAVLVDADGKGLESIRMDNVLMYWFMGGTALTLKATNNGAIAYGSFQNLRIRHAKFGISMEADEGSFVNSNTFYGGAISGTIEDAAVMADSVGACNDNTFYSMVIEPPKTAIAHVFVKGSKTNIRMHDVRLEGTEMAFTNHPLVIIDPSSYGNVLTGMVGHTHVQADFNRNPGIDAMSAKSVSLDAAPLNHFWNAAFKGFDSEKNEMPGWETDENGEVSISDSSEEYFANHNVIHVRHVDGYGGPFRLEPKELPRSNGHSMATFGIYARTTVPNAIVAAMRYESGSIISSAGHSGSGEWEFIGMEGLYDKSAPYFYFAITHDVELTAPTFVYGNTPATPGAELMSSSGARMAGTLSLGMATASPPEDGGTKWVLPKNEGNIFTMDMGGSASRTIQRINESVGDRFPGGTVITLLFPEAGTTVQNGGYLFLKGNFHSTARSSLTLVANGDPTWTEVSRNL
ncbi:MAG: hypothetical protein SGILL_007130 [Bacillariaceae sp.]